MCITSTVKQKRVKSEHAKSFTFVLYLQLQQKFIISRIKFKHDINSEPLSQWCINVSTATSMVLSNNRNVKPCSQQTN